MRNVLISAYPKNLCLCRHSGEDRNPVSERQQAILIPAQDKDVRSQNLWVFGQPLILICLLVVSLFGFEKNPYFSSAEELEAWFWDSTSNDVANRLQFELEDTTNGKAVWKIFALGGCELCGSVYVLYDWNSDSILCGHGLIAGIDFGGEEFGEECLKVNRTIHQDARAKIILRYFIEKEMRNSLNKIHTSAISLRKQKEIKSSSDFAMNIVEYLYWRYVPITSSNVSLYNDLGFFLEQGGKYAEAVILLSEVVKAVPDRTVAWLNLGDAQKGLGKVEEAKASYRRYIELMEKAGKGSKVPKRVREYLSQG